MNKILWLDTETTGLNAVKQDVIQIAGMVEINGEVHEEFEYKCQPYSWDDISDQALEVHGYSRDHLKTFDPPTIIKSRVEAILSRWVDKFDKNDKFILAGYNVEFDNRFMREFWKKSGDKYWGSFVEYKVYDGYPLFQAFANAHQLDVPNHKLVTAAEFFGYNFGAHDALEDIQVTRKVVKDLEAIMKIGGDHWLAGRERGL